MYIQPSNEQLLQFPLRMFSINNNEPKLEHRITLADIVRVGLKRQTFFYAETNSIYFYAVIDGILFCEFINAQKLTDKQFSMIRKAFYGDYTLN